MTTAGSVPQQGIIVGEATTAKRRGDPGILGKGTPGSRLKAQWRKSESNFGLKEWVTRATARDPADKELQQDAERWLNAKRGRSPEQLKAREARRDRIDRQNSSREAKSSGKISVPKKETSRSAR